MPRVDLAMPCVDLAGRSIFVLEHDATDAYRLRTVLEAAHAEVMFAFDVGKALVRVVRFNFNAAVLDGIDCAVICKALGNVPFMFYVGRASPQVFREWPQAPVIVKPATAKTIVETIAKLLGE